MTAPKTKAAALSKQRKMQSGNSGPGTSPPQSNRTRLIAWVLIAMSVSFAGGFFWNHLVPLFPLLPEPIAEDTPQPDIPVQPVLSHNPPAAEPEPQSADHPAQSSVQEPTAQEQENSQAIADIKTALASLEESLDTLSTAFISATERLDQIEATLEKTPAGTARDWSVLIAIGHIRQSLQNGQAYAADLAILTPMLADHPMASRFLEDLAPYAESGVPSRGELSRNFSSHAALWAQAPEAGTSQESAGIWKDTIQRLKALVRIRRTGEQAGNTPEARVARAEHHLNADDLAAAGAELLSIPEAQLWARQAIGRVKAEKALHDLTSWAMDQP